MNRTGEDRNRRILVIDDNPAIHDDFRKVLGAESNPALQEDEALLFGEESAQRKETRFAIDYAHQGEEGLALVRDAVEAVCPYAMAFVDMRMPPGWDGIETIEHIWQEYPELQAVICTAYSDYSWDEMICRFGETDRLLILKKPFDAVEVRQLALALTEKWNLNRLARLKLCESQRAEEALQRHALELRVALDALANARKHERQVLASIPSICIGLRDDGTLTHWNAAAEKVFGLRGAEVVGKQFWSLGIGWSWERIKGATSRCRTQDEPVPVDELRFVDSEGRERVLGLTVNRIQAVPDGAAGIVLVGSDVTERKNMESQLMLAQKMESLGQLAAGIAHEINTPAQYVGDNTCFLSDAFRDLVAALTQYEKLCSAAKDGTLSPQTLADVEAAIADADLEYLTDAIPKAIEQSLEGLGRVTKIVRSMKGFAHPDQDEKASADLNQALGSTGAVSRNEWKYVAELEFDLDPNLPPVPCLLGGINQVILNMIVNASHAIADVVGDGSNGKGAIRISTRRLEEAVEIRVRDTGAGIPEEIRTRIFDPFFTTKEVGKGSGQGLALAYNIIVEKHGGTIVVESEVGKGTTFIVTLPVEKEVARVTG